MTRTARQLTPSRGASRRRGTAPLEFVIFLPLAVLMVAAMVSATQVGMSDTMVSTVARDAAFAGRQVVNQYGPNVPTGNTTVSMRAIADILGPRPRANPDRGLVVAEMTKQPRALFNRWRGVLPQSRGLAAVVGDSWDFRRITFPRHGRLQLSEKVNFFGGGRVADLGAFSRFLGQSIGAGSFSLGDMADAVAEGVSEGLNGGQSNASPVRTFVDRLFRGVQFVQGVAGTFVGGGMMVAGAVTSPVGGGLLFAAGAVITLHSVDQAQAAVRGVESYSSRAGGSIVAGVFGEDHRWIGQLAGDVGPSVPALIRGVRRLPEAVDGLRSRAAQLRDVVAGLRNRGRLRETITRLAATDEGLLELDAMVRSGAVTRGDLRRAGIDADFFGLGTGRAGRPGQNIALGARLTAQLRLQELADPLADSLRTSGDLPAAYVTKETAELSGWKPGKVLGNFLPDAQLGGDVIKYPVDMGLEVRPGRIWRKADIGVDNMAPRRLQSTRVVYSNDGLMYGTDDHYQTFYELRRWDAPTGGPNP